MTFREANLSDLDKIVNLHKITLSSASASLGGDYLKNNYQLIITHPEINLTLLALENKRIIGVITASLDLKKTLKILSKIPVSAYFSAAKSILLKPYLLVEFIKHIYLEYKLINKYPSPYRTILTLFVSKDYQRMGIGRELIRIVVKEFKLRNIKKIYVDTLSSNKKALIFYKKSGFKIEGKVANSTMLSFKSVA